MSGNFDIIFNLEGSSDAVRVTASLGESILDVAKKANVAIDAPCSGNGSCGKCRVRLLDGNVDAASSRHITDEALAEGWRLACVCKVSGAATLMVPDIASAYKSRMRVTDMSSRLEVKIFNDLQDGLRDAGIALHSGIRAVAIVLDAPTLDDTMPDNERVSRAVCAATGAESASIDFTLLRRLPDALRNANFDVRAVIAERDGAVTVLDVVPSGDDTPICGLAIDIGTTTVSVLLTDLETGRIIAKGSSGNGQIRYGADVINRIIEQQKAGGIARLRDAVVNESLAPIIAQLCADAGVKRERIYGAIVASNTTMNHLLLGINANHLRMEPYIPAFFEAEPILARDLGLELAGAARVAIAPNIGSYVGGDITAGALACMLWNTDEMTLLVDLGTNGELVFGNRDFLMACACSAGPAFEGGDIKCGMRATDGAIEDCKIDAATMEPTLTIIGDAGQKPVGICGSGIIDLIAELFRAGIINGKGKFAREGERVIYDEEYGGGRYILARADESATGREVFIDETDIDNFIRTKGAIFSAIMSLTTPLGFSPEDIERVYVAGGIGSGINIKNAITIGMFPHLPEERFRYIGNSSLTGAYAALTSTDASEKLAELARSITYVELSTQPGYMDEFVAACFLPHTNSALFPQENA